MLVLFVPRSDFDHLSPGVKHSFKSILFICIVKMVLRIKESYVAKTEMGCTKLTWGQHPCIKRTFAVSLTVFKLIPLIFYFFLIHHLIYLTAIEFLFSIRHYPMP